MTAIAWCVLLFATFGLAAIVFVPRVIIPDSRSARYDEILRVATTRNSIRGTIAQIVAGLAFVATFIQSSVNFSTDYRQKSDLATSDQFAKAFSQLRESSGNPWVTIGSFHMLSNVAEKDPRYHEPVYAAMAQYVVSRSRRECGMTAANGETPKKEYRNPEYSIDEAVRAATRLILERGPDDRGRRQLDLEGACLANADAFATKGFSWTYMPGAKLLRISAGQTAISDADFRGVEAGVVHNTNWAEYSGLGAWSLHRVTPEKLARLRANFENAKFENVSMQGAGFEGANFQGVSFVRSRLAGTNFRLADLRGASFGNSDLNGTTLWGANIARADLSKANNLSAAQVLSACIRDDPAVGSSIIPKLSFKMSAEVEKAGGIQPCE
jgi:uncharacterized protein YjbI with pentapeptide repeats